MANISYMSALILATLLITVPCIAVADPVPAEEDPLALAPVVDYEDPPFYPPESNEPDELLPKNDEDFPGFKSKNEVLKFALKCTDIADLDTNCGREYHESVFIKDAKPSVKCCKKLVKQGKVCHNTITLFIIRFGNLGYDRKTSLVRSENVWKHCTLAVK